jgi:hypothetical protein
MSRSRVHEEAFVRLQQRFPPRWPTDNGDRHPAQALRCRDYAGSVGREPVPVVLHCEGTEPFPGERSFAHKDALRNRDVRFLK